ncbi:hypothetical protein [Bradyrhizobium sp. BR 10289]|uniref:hypothetical protein n=1 Tax=Bradyrhizobium sp. BR 10289 TaxID=2749993 RepID=UPI001C649C42|nr:hypothetical protein [Bradyrhizobium sp. BR 10289]MBW7968136.1 hypothetical protein [Bradyrhizobium sp. BR 10289]
MRYVAALFYLAVASGLSGCASINYIVNEYRGVEVREVKMAEDTYRVFDKPAESKMMVTSSLGSAAGQGFAKGLTFGAAQTEPPKPLFERAALQFLTESGRPGCRVLDAYLLASPQWEVKYDCSPVVAAAQPPSSARSARPQRESKK